MKKIGFLKTVSLCLALLCRCSLCLAENSNLVHGGGPITGREDGYELFEKSVRPLLLRHCIECHGPEKQKSGLRLDNRDFIGESAEAGALVVRGRPDASRVIKAIRYSDPDLQMPPDGKLSDAEIEVMTAWIAEGAAWPNAAASIGNTATDSDFDLESRRASHWAWQPVEPPTVPPVEDQNWPSDSVDRFILAKLEENGLVPAQLADRRTLIRRLSFDLIGLPPTPAEVEKFVADESPKAYEKIVDRLLTSPHFGERWGRHWLDLARYAETYGHERNQDIFAAWRYRDYVIRAYNDDLPYDQFVREQIAGDLLHQPRRHPAEGFNESLIGTGFNWLGEENKSPVDLDVSRAERIDNQIDVIFKTFQGLTVSCARCHNHKFDAISQEDYYALFGILKSSHYAKRAIDLPAATTLAAEEIEKLQPAVRTAIGNLWLPQADKSAAYLKAARELLTGQVVSKYPNTFSDETFDGFTDANYASWQLEGEAFAHGPVSLAYTNTILTAINVPGSVITPGAMSPAASSHPIGIPAADPRFASRYATTGHRLTGSMTSQSFPVSNNYLHFQIAGGCDERTALEVLVDGSVVGRAIGREEHRMRFERLDLSEFLGRTAAIRLVDRRIDDQYGYISVGKLVFSDDSISPFARHGIGASAHRMAVDLDLDPIRLARWVDAVAEARGTSDSTTAEDVTPLELNWSSDGLAFAETPVSPGATVFGSNAEHPVRSVLPAGWRHSGVLAGALNGLLRSNSFTLDAPFVHVRVLGDEAQVNLRVSDTRINTPPIYNAAKKLISHHNDSPRWMTFHVELWVGRNAYLELIDRLGRDAEDVFRFGRDYASRASVGIAEVVISDSERPPIEIERNRLYLADSALERSPEVVAAQLRNAVVAWFNTSRGNGKMKSPQAQLLWWAARHNLLSPTPGELLGKQRRLSRLLAEVNRLDAAIPPARLAMSMIDSNGDGAPIYIRGDTKRLGKVVPRRPLEATSGTEPPAITEGSGRYELALHLASSNNPLTARVMVNRIWHHLFGRGIVPTVDNFGAMGEQPSHPLLLDHLAANFTAGGWSQKRLIRAIVLSSTYRMASAAASPAYAKVDPENRLLHRANVRRLQGEAIRDSILAVSGKLSHRTYGPPAEKGKQAQQAYRRSVYLRVDRNGPRTMFAAFDVPQPFTTIGRRDVSNVPTQALTMMNDPFVLKQADAWADASLEDQSTESENRRIERLYHRAFAREPLSDETTSAREFLEGRRQRYLVRGEAEKAERLAWRDLCHAVYNTKEFIFLF